MTARLGHVLLFLRTRLRVLVPIDPRPIGTASMPNHNGHNQARRDHPCPPGSFADGDTDAGGEVRGVVELHRGRAHLWVKDGLHRHLILPVRERGNLAARVRGGEEATARIHGEGGGAVAFGVRVDPGGTVCFEELTTVSPTERLSLETEPDRLTTRVIDIVAPVGKGQRGLIVAPPRTGKTTLLQHIGEAVLRNNPETRLIVLLVDERPEEVTEMGRTLGADNVMASSSDSDAEMHTRLPVLAVERAKRLVESGRDVVMLVDSLTRIGRAFNNSMGPGGRTMSGGVDSRALHVPRRLFAAARNTEEAGSLTIMATALVETGSRMDELIFQEFKGTGNMEVVLGRRIAEQRIWPAVDIFLSGTRREELIVGEETVDRVNAVRRSLAGEKPEDAAARLVSIVARHRTNGDLLDALGPGATGS